MQQDHGSPRGVPVLDVAEFNTPGNPDRFEGVCHDWDFRSGPGWHLDLVEASFYHPTRSHAIRHLGEQATGTVIATGLVLGRPLDGVSSVDEGPPCRAAGRNSLRGDPWSHRRRPWRRATRSVETVVPSAFRVALAGKRETCRTPYREQSPAGVKAPQKQPRFVIDYAIDAAGLDAALEHNQRSLRGDVPLAGLGRKNYMPAPRFRRVDGLAIPAEAA